RGVLVEERAEEAAGDQQRGQRALHGAAWLRRAAPRAGAEGGAVFVGAAMSVGAAVASLGAGLSHAPRGLVVGRGVAVVSVSSEAMRRASRVTSTPTTAPPRAMRTGRVLPKSPSLGRRRRESGTVASGARLGRSPGARASARACPISAQLEKRRAADLWRARDRAASTAGSSPRLAAIGSGSSVW